MTFLIELDEATAARRRVPFRVFNSDGTSPDTGFSTVTVLHSINGGAQVVSANSSSVVSANAGQYYIEFTQAEVGTLGSMAVFIDAQAADFPQHVANVQVVNSNPMSTQSNVQNVTVAAGTYSNVTFSVDQVETVQDKTGYQIAPGTYSNVTFSCDQVETVQDKTGYTVDTVNDKTGYTIAAGTYSNVTFSCDQVETVQDKTGYTIAPGTYSNVTFSVDQVETVQDKTGYQIAPGTYSNVTFSVDQVETVLDKTDYTLSAVGRNLVAVDSADSVWDELRSGHVAAGSFGQYVNTDVIVVPSGVTIVGSSLSQVADAVLTRSLAGSAQTDQRSVQNALRFLRNRVDATSSVLTVFQEDDSTSAWTASITTTTDPSNINEIDPR